MRKGRDGKRKEEEEKNDVFSGHYVIASSLPPERLRPNDDRWNAARSCQKNWVINDSLRWKKIFDLALHGFKRKLVFLTINKPLPPLLVVPTSRLPSRETLEGGGRDNPPTWPPPSWDPNPLRLPLWSSRGKGVVQGISYSKRVTYYIRLAAAPNPWVGFPGQCGPMVG